MLKLFISFFVLFILSANSAFAASDPTSVPNNKFGINILSPEAEIEDANALVNTNGDWGYVVITITKNERSIERWQNFLNQANKYHLIPIVRLATEFDSENGYWKRPSENDAKDWAEFLSKLYFPTKNRYIQVYNEVNRDSEWGGSVDPASYTSELDRTIDALKSKSNDFFILNAPLDLALQNSKSSMEASEFFKAMDTSTESGIFKRLDGWASHSYPNPNFSSSPRKLGKIGIRGYDWELSEISPYVQDKKLPVFITETGWQRIENGLSEDQISEYYKEAFGTIWNDERIAAVAPFVLGYPEPLFNQFSFKINSGEKSYYKYFDTIRDLPKVKGAPQRDDSFSNFRVFVPNYFVKSIGSYITINFKNTGNHLWSLGNLKIKIAESDMDDYHVFWYKDKFYPGDEVQAVVLIKSDTYGTNPLTIQILNEGNILGERKIYLRSETSLSLFIQKLRTLL
ncbi:MAG: hypothetical protein AAB521_05045 [Patescibacteria group bacterium]